MEELFAELSEAVALVVYAALAGGLTILGLLAEFAGLSGVTSGLNAHTAWLLYVGIISMAAGVTIARRKLLPVVRTA